MINSISSIDLAVVAAYFIVISAIGFKSRMSRNAAPREFILAGRRLSLPGFIATIVTTWYGGIMGVGENTFNYGIQTWFILGLPYYIFAFIFALLIAPKIRKMNFISIPEHFTENYGKKSGLISALFILFLASPAPYILSMGILLQFTLNVPFIPALLLSTFFSIIYIWFGGFRAVVRTDIFQFFLMFGGFIILLIYAWLQYGSPRELLSSLPPSHLSFTGGHSLQYILVWFFIAMWTFVDPGFYQRCAAAKSPRTARNGILLSIIFWFIFDMLTLSAGLYAKMILPESESLFAYPMLGKAILPSFIYGCFLTGLLATIMSTIDSLGLISAITFGKDILLKVRDYAPKHASYLLPRAIRTGLIITNGIAILLAIIFPSVVQLWYLIGSIIIPGLLLPFILTFINRDIIHRNSVPIVMTVPVLISAAWFIIGMFIHTTFLNIEPFYPGLLTSIILILMNKNFQWKRE